MTSSSSSSSEHSLPALWRHAMRAYGRWQGYAWSVVVVASGTAYALSLGLRRESGRRANDVDDDGGGGGGGR